MVVMKLESNQLSIQCFTTLEKFNSNLRSGTNESYEYKL